MIWHFLENVNENREILFSKTVECVAIITETSFRKMKTLLGYFLLGFTRVEKLMFGMLSYLVAPQKWLKIE